MDMKAGVALQTVDLHETVDWFITKVDRSTLVSWHNRYNITKIAIFMTSDSFVINVYVKNLGHDCARHPRIITIHKRKLWSETHYNFKEKAYSKWSQALN